MFPSNLLMLKNIKKSFSQCEKWRLKLYANFINFRATVYRNNRQNESAAKERNTQDYNIQKNMPQTVLSRCIFTSEKSNITCETRRRKIKIRCPLFDITWCESVNVNENFFFFRSVNFTSAEFCEKKEVKKIDRKKIIIENYFIRLFSTRFISFFRNVCLWPIIQLYGNSWCELVFHCDEHLWRK